MASSKTSTLNNGIQKHEKGIDTKTRQCCLQIKIVCSVSDGYAKQHDSMWPNKDTLDGFRNGLAQSQTMRKVFRHTMMMDGMMMSSSMVTSPVVVGLRILMGCWEAKQ